MSSGVGALGTGLLLVAVAASAQTTVPPPRKHVAPPASRAGGAPARDRSPRLRGFGAWRRNADLRSFAQKFAFAPVAFERQFPERDSSVQKARAVAASGAAQVAKATVETLARVLYILELEATPGDAKAFQGKLAARAPAILERVRYYHAHYDVPCRAGVRRSGATWPPRYECGDNPVPPSAEPTPVLALRQAPQAMVRPPSDPAEKEQVKKKADAALAALRQRELARRDQDVVPHENLAGAMPSQFCFAGRCFGKHAEVAAAIYGSGRAAAHAPVFCAPKKQGASWETSRVECSGDWLATLGGWRPWSANGEPAAPPEPGVIPPVACIGSPHLLGTHTLLPPGGAAGGSGFHCRNRLFRILSTKGAKNQADVNANIATMCLEMRGQVWGEKYPNINDLYAKWCASPEGPADKSRCPKVPRGGGPGPGGAPALPFMLLSREELLFFFGHQELYCRADRPGLTHFLFNKEWAKTFTCGISRGLVEAGPFEEGVQTCAIAPYTGREPRPGVLRDEHMKARLHCWQFNRPTCEEVSRDQTKDDIHRSAVFDVLDSLAQVRRTQHPDAWGLYDLKDADKLSDWEEVLSFQDTAVDESTFGVKEFCRFVGGTTKLRCGYTKQSVAQWYELRSGEAPEGCGSGICARGAYGRGYLCGLFRSSELFDRKPYWICGIDAGLAGRSLLRSAQALCVGGARVKGFQSSKGDKGSLQCYERRFLWGESEKSEAILRRFTWSEAVAAAARFAPRNEPWLGGGGQATRRIKDLDEAIKQNDQWITMLTSIKNHKDANTRRGWGANFQKERAQLLAGLRAARGAFADAAKKDERELVTWAAAHGHTLGHRTSLRIGFMRSKLSVVHALRALRFEKQADNTYRPLGPRPAEYHELKYERDKDSPDDVARSKDKAKELNGLVEEVVRGSRAPDQRWYQDFRLAATDGGQLRISPQKLLVAARVGHLFEVLAAARRIVLREARAYADAVFAAARGAERLSRLELHERARESAIPAQLKGSVFCVATQDPRDQRAYRPVFLCASSPLLVAGRVERAVTTRIGRSVRRGSEAQEDARQDKIRKKVKFGWCFGGTRGAPLYGPRPSRALYARGLSSPYQLGIPGSVILGRAVKTRSIDAKPPPKKEGASEDVVYAPPQAKSASHWLRCANFTYSDEDWREADPSREPKEKQKAPAQLAGAPPPPAEATADDMEKAGNETSKIMEQVGGLLSSLIKVVLPDLGDALDRVKDLANAAQEFYDKYVKKFVDIAKKVWEVGKKAIETVKNLRERGLKAFDDARGVFHKAEIALAAASPELKAKLEPKKKQAEDKFNEMRKALQGHEKAVTQAIDKAGGTKTIDGTGDILGDMLEEILEVVTKRITAVIEPRARALLAKGFEFLRSVLDPLAMSVISALGSIPFVGGVLAPLGKYAYKMAMDALADLAFKALLPLVERLLSKLLRGVVTPIFNAVKNVVVQLAFKACNALFGAEVCPKGGDLRFSALPPQDRWIERALACPPKEIIDDRVREEAVAARMHIFREGRRMLAHAHDFAREISDRYFARYGLTTREWVAAFSGPASPEWVARAAAIERDLRAEGERVRARLEEGRR